jgi:hypothetical protein
VVELAVCMHMNRGDFFRFFFFFFVIKRISSVSDVTQNIYDANLEYIKFKYP